MPCMMPKPTATHLTAKKTRQMQCSSGKRDDSVSRLDGVLHPEPCYRDEELFCRRALFESVLRDFPKVEIVVSSTWRDTRDLATLQGFFSPDVARSIVSVTPSWRDLPELIDVIGQYPRHVEVEGWLRQQGRVWESWIALDDRAYWFKPFLPNLVHCDSSTGLDEKVASALRHRLQLGS